MTITPQHEIYKAILGTATQSSEALEGVIQQIKQALEAIIRAQYENNKALMKIVVANPSNPILAQQASSDAKPAIEALQSTLNELAETNKERIKMETTMNLLQNRSAGNPEVKKSLENNLHQIDEANKQYQEKFALTSAQAALLGKADFADPKLQKQLDKTLNSLYLQTQELKAQIKQKHTLVQNVEQNTRPRPGK